MSQPTVLMAIPARGGSKRVPRKNLSQLAGKPMLAYTIEAALQANLADRVYVCTDDDEIGEVAESFGAHAFRIDGSLAGDDVSSTEPCLALHAALRSGGEDIEFICNLQPSSPLRTAEDVCLAYDHILTVGASFLVSATAIDPHYFHWAVVERECGWEMYFEEEFLKERVLLPPVFRPNGAIKLARAAALWETRHYFGTPLATYEMPENRSIHVATAFDLVCASALLEGE